jgi:hypothetical protein
MNTVRAPRSDPQPLSSLREKIADGSYAVDSRKVADSIIRYIAVTGQRLDLVPEAGRSPLRGEASQTG